MGRMKMGHDPRNRKSDNRTVLGQGLISAMTDVARPSIQEMIDKAIAGIEIKAPETVIEKHTEAVLKEVRTRDVLARRHSRLVTKKVDKIVVDLTDILNVQNDIIHGLKKTMHETQAQALMAVQYKPQEKQVVTKEVVTTVQQMQPAQHSKLVLGGVILAIALSVLSLIIK